MEKKTKQPQQLTLNAKLSVEITEQDLAKEITHIFMCKNRMITPEILVFTAKQLLSYIVENFRNYKITLDDIKVAFKKGVLGEYGEYYDLSFVELCKWLRAYIASDDYIKKFEVPRKALPAKTNFISEEERIILNFQNYRKTKQLSIVQHVSIMDYNYLERNNIIVNSSDSFSCAIEEAKKFYEEQKKTKHGVNSRIYIQEVLNKNFKLRVEEYAKIILLKKFYDKVIEKHKEEDFIIFIKNLKKC